jgi:hypothetical protein
MAEERNTLQLLDGGPTNCGGGYCPAIYKDATGRIFIQGAKAKSELRDGVAVADHEEVVELTPELINFLKVYQG